MDKKRLIKVLPPEDLKGFEEFIESQPGETSFLPRPSAIVGNKKETSFEHFTFLTTDAERLLRIRNLAREKLPFSAKYEQGKTLIQLQSEEIVLLKKKLFQICDNPGSPYMKSIEETFDSFFNPSEGTKP